ncbi:MAG: RsiV family protein [Lachnospiraceae bacterium]|nr:RsiV family protein [Lachnospiraceae bacterium]
MLKRIRKTGFAAGLATMIAVSGLCGCADSSDVMEIDPDALAQYAEETDEEIVGQDWRTWGWISGWITLKNGGGEDWDIAVVYQGDPGSYHAVDFYFNDENQSLIQSIELPAGNMETLEVAVENLDDDGFDDISISGKDTKGNEYTWFYTQIAEADIQTDDLFTPYEEGIQEDNEEEETSEVPELISSEFDFTLSDENDEYTVFECYGNSYVLDEEYEEKYPELAQALKEFDEAERAEMQRNLDSLGEEAKEFAAGKHEEDEFGFYISDSEEHILNCDDRVVSLLRSQCFYFDQPHPNYYYVTYNIDVGSGQLIPLSDIIADKEGLDKVLAERLIEEYPEVEFTDLEETLATFDPDAEPLQQDAAPYCFTMDSEGLTFHFAQEALANYAYGPQEIQLSYDEIRELLTDGFEYGTVG